MRTGFAFLLWVVARLFLVFFVSSYISDVPYYHWLAMEHVWGAKKLYVDSQFAYPPLAIPFVLWPAYLSRNLSAETYALCFRATMFFVELATLGLMIRFGRRRLALDDRRMALAIVWLTVFGCLQCHLIYDRMDLGVPFFLLGSLLLWEASLIFASGWAVLGNLFKIVPAMFFAFALGSKAVDRWDDQAFPQRWLRRANVFIGGFLPVILVPILFEALWFPGMSRSMLDHLRRGIQIESVWAMPLMVWRALDPSIPLKIEDFIGASEVVGPLVQPWYVALSKITGFLIITIVFYRFLRQPRELRSSPQNQLHVALSFILVFLASQRVLSPQYFLWLIPFAALWLAFRKRIGQSLGFLSLYGLTYVSFDIGYMGLLNNELLSVTGLAVRNLLLIVLACIVSRPFFWGSRVK